MKAVPADIPGSGELGENQPGGLMRARALAIAGAVAPAIASAGAAPRAADDRGSRAHERQDHHRQREVHNRTGLTVPADQSQDIKPLITILGGRVVSDADAAVSTP
jgi:hypothetical protein